MTIETNDMGFWNKMKEILEECFSSPKVKEPTEIEPTNIDLEEQTPAPQPEPEPVVEPSEPQTEPEPTTTKVEENNEPVEPTPEPVEEPKQQDNHLEELINNLKEEIAALKTSNGELQEKIKEMGKTPSAQPVNVNAKPNAGDTYSAWRDQVEKMMMG